MCEEGTCVAGVDWGSKSTHTYIIVIQLHKHTDAVTKAIIMTVQITALR